MRTIAGSDASATVTVISASQRSRRPRAAVRCLIDGAIMGARPLWRWWRSIGALGITWLITWAGHPQSTPPPDRARAPPTGTAFIKGREIAAHPGFGLAGARV